MILHQMIVQGKQSTRLSKRKRGKRIIKKYFFIGSGISLCIRCG
ncbi:hypothetical protein AALP_AAs65810U000200 [Arabis alpina]|uniref:Uncharacterized protein n=1 Tax=Arabis alpina TaxID=50452 RepID=A0A087G3T8_ARAAL|nr:hypothetical protein AALP_AAs65810U000200 [Arabis alpina]